MEFKIQYRDLSKFTPNNGKLIVRNLPIGMNEREFRLLTQNFQDHITWIKLYKQIIIRNLCFVQIQPLEVVEAFINELQSQFYDSKGNTYRPTVELSLNQNIPPPMEIREVNLEEQEGFLEFKHHLETKVEKFKPEVQDGILQRSQLIESIHAQHEQGLEKKAKRKKWSRKEGKKEE